MIFPLFFNLLALILVANYYENRANYYENRVATGPIITKTG
jgi:hypothetical protein